MRLFLAMLLICLGSATTFVGAKEVVMAFSLAIPPYTLPETESGVEVDVAREALAYRGHTLVPKFFPLDRLPLAFRYGRVDASMMDLGQDLTDAGGHYADPAVVYDDVLITLKERNLKIEKPADLADLFVISYVGARHRYGEWVAPPDQIGLYFERTNQEWQALGLLRGNFDVMLTDRYIFYYFAHKLERDRGLKLKPIVEHRFMALNPQHYRPVFRDPKVRDDFNVGLQYLKDSGRYQAIYDSYLQIEGEDGHNHSMMVPTGQ